MSLFGLEMVLKLVTSSSPMKMSPLSCQQSAKTMQMQRSQQASAAKAIEAQQGRLNARSKTPKVIFQVAFLSRKSMENIVMCVHIALCASLESLESLGSCVKVFREQSLVVNVFCFL